MEVIPPLILAHGASGDAASMEQHVKGLRARGIDAKALDIPRSNATRAAQRFVDVTGERLGVTALGGHSYGGRVASLVAAEHDVAGLVLLSYPLHRPGHFEDPRTEHWGQIACPVLLLSGEADPFARIDELRDAVRSLRHATLITYPHVGHGLGPVLEDALDQIAAFLRAVNDERH